MSGNTSKRLCEVLFVLFIWGIGQGESEILTNRQGAKPLASPENEVSFPFVILGDRTTGKTEGLGILRQAVDEINLLRPDFVITIGDMVEGYNARQSWEQQAQEYLDIMKHLTVPWYPTAGNHDIAWRGEGRPEDEHEGDFERVFGPVWYAIKHKNCWFIVLFGDEGDPQTGERTFHKDSAQKVSPRQTAWLKEMLEKAKGADQVFLFIHHPRWKGGNYGDDWQRIHKMLVEAGNVSAVFAGHDHVMRYFGNQDGIEYYTIGATGGWIPEEVIQLGQKPHYFQVTVRGKKHSVVSVPVGHLSDPKDMQAHCLLEETQWRIDSPDKRRLEFPVEAKDLGSPMYILLAVVGHGFSHTGDGGIWGSIEDPTGKTLTKKFLKSEKMDWMFCMVADSVPYRIVLEDQDTEFTGPNPGNSGTIQVYVKPMTP